MSPATKGPRRHTAQLRALRREIERVDAIRAAVSAIVDHLQLGLLLVDARGRIVRRNAIARAICARCDAVSIRRGFLTAVEECADAPLRSALQRASSSDRRGSLGDITVVPLRSGASGPGAAAFVVPVLDRSARSAADEPVAAVFLIDPAEGGADQPGLLAELFGFTRRESEVACALLDGRTPKEMAAALGVSVHTVRTHLKRVMDATYASRQSDLVRRLSTAIPAVRVHTPLG